MLLGGALRGSSHHPHEHVTREEVLARQIRVAPADWETSWGARLSGQVRCGGLRPRFKQGAEVVAPLGLLRRAYEGPDDLVAAPVCWLAAEAPTPRRMRHDRASNRARMWRDWRRSMA
jgi:hypothetical protein